jgi:MFS family permease
VRGVFKMMFSKKMLFLIPELMWTGISISIYTGLLVPLIYDTMPAIETNNEKFESSMMAMISLGVGEIFGGIVMGVIVDKIGTKKSCFVNIINVFIACSLVIIYLF